MEYSPDLERKTISRGLPGEQLDDVINRFLSAEQGDPFTSWLLLPTERLVRFVTDCLIQRSLPFIPTRISTIEGFCRVLFEENRTTERLLSKSEAKLLLTHVLEEHATEVSFFITRDHPSPGTIDDLMTFMNVTLTRKVPFPECLVNLQSEKSRQLDTIITEYRNCLRGLDLVDGDTILEWTIDYLNRSTSPPLGKVFVYGFHEPLPLEEDLFEAVRERAGQAHFFVPDGIDQNIFRSHASGGSTGIQPSWDPSSVPARMTGLFSEPGSLADAELFRVQTFSTR